MIRRGLARLWYWGAVVNRITGWRASRLNGFLYRISRGRIGGWVPGATVILLTTTGRRTGRPITVPVAVVNDGDNLVVGAGAGGSSTHPQWYRNIVASPLAVVNEKGTSYPVRAQVLEGDERDRVVRDLIAPRPLFDIQYRRTSRVVPLLRLTRT